MTRLIDANHLAKQWAASLSQEKIQNAIDIQPKVMEAIIVADGGHTTYMSNGSSNKGD